MSETSDRPVVCCIGGMSVDRSLRLHHTAIAGTSNPVSTISESHSAASSCAKAGVAKASSRAAKTAGASSLIYLDETERLLDNCDEAERVVDTEALGPFSEHVLVMQWRGGAHVLTGAFDLGYALARKGNDFWNGNGGRVCNAMFRSWIVRGLQGLGRFDEAIELNGRNIAHCRETGDRYMEPECVRLQGELRLAVDPADTGSAERLFRDAMELARAHGARSWQLRAAMSLAGLLASRDRRAEAAGCLEPVLNGFTEGLETADLRRARDMLAAVG